MDLRFPTLEDDLLVVLKLVGESCNVNCHYCYERRKPYDSSQNLKPDAVAKFLKSFGHRPLSILLHGGEPLLMKRTRMAEIMRVIRSYPGPTIVRMQTNGTLLDDEWLDFFAAECPGIEIGISIDGDEEGNSHRVDFRDRPIYGKIAASLDLMNRRGLTVGVIVVITRRVLGRAPGIVSHLMTFPAIRAVKLSPCLDFNVVTKPYRTNNKFSLRVLNPSGEGRPGWATTPLEYAHFATEAFDAWRSQRAFDQFTVEPFISIIRTLAGKPVGFESFSSRKAPFVVTLYPDGRIGTTDEIDLPASLIGSLDSLTTIDTIVGFQRNHALREQMQRLLDKCEGCSHATTCRGGMLSERMPYEGTAYDDEYCAARKLLIDHVANAISDIPLAAVSS